MLFLIAFFQKYFCAAIKMKIFRYITVIFFICLFVFNGLCTVFPKLFASNKPLIEKLYSSENESEKKEKSERAEEELKELYLNNIYPYGLLSINSNVIERNTIPYEAVCKKNVHLSIPTPPPELL